VSRTKAETGAKGTASPSDEPYDQIVARLEKVVESLEGGRLTLEQSIEKFAEGVALSREAGRKLDEAERRVETLLRADDGSVEGRPIEGDESAP
jgi:exodeoxyribonuclease VII small subunit